MPGTPKNLTPKNASAKARDVTQIGAAAGGSMARVLRRAKALQSLDTLVKHQLDPSLRQHCQVANLRDHKLIIAVSSAAWVLAIRAAAPQVIAGLAAKQIKVTEVLPRVLPSLGATPEVPRQQKTLSHSANVALTQFSKYCDDADICAAIDRLTHRTGAE